MDDIADDSFLTGMRCSECAGFLVGDIGIAGVERDFVGDRCFLARVGRSGFGFAGACGAMAFMPCMPFMPGIV